MMVNKCCVGDCNSNSETHRLFCFPRNDYLRKLWLDFLVPTNSNLIGLTKEQLLRKYVCERHFDKSQYDQSGQRIRFSYPCLFSAAEIHHGMPMSKTRFNFLSDHNYFNMQDDDDDDTDSSLFIAKAEDLSTLEHNYCLKSGNPSTSVRKQSDTASILAQPTCLMMGTKPPVESTKCTTDSASIHDAQCSPMEIELLSTSKQNIYTTTVQEHVCTPVGNEVQSSTKKKGSIKKSLSSKKRKFLKKVQDIAAESIGNTASERLQQAQLLCEDKNFLKNFNLLNKQAKNFVIMQLRLARKNKMARRFTLEDKLLALMIMKRGPKCYKLLENMFALPNKRTLHRLSEKICFEPGVNPQILRHIKQTTKNWTQEKRLCTIVFDEVALTPHITFDEHKDVIDGFVGDTNIKFSDHALVMMIRGICSSWRQSIAYYFCEGTVPVPELQRILKKIIPDIAETGLIPLGLVCDQGSTFRTAIRNLREATVRLRNTEGVHDDGTIQICGYNLYSFFDPPHLLKGIRNNFINKDILWKGQIATWRDIAFIFDLDNKLGHTRTLPNLTEHHIDPTKLKKMKVSVAAQVLSSRTAAMLKFTHTLDKLRGVAANSTMGTTAEVVEFFDRLFDSVNGYPGGATKGKLRKAVKPNSMHMEFWREAIKTLKNMKFVIQAGQRSHASVPTVEGWIKTLESFIGITELLFSKYHLEYFYPRYINQDPLENFFGRIRAYNYRNVNPNAYAFKYTFKSLVLSNIISPHSEHANCERDDGETLIGVDYLFNNKEEDKENATTNIQVSSSSLPSTSGLKTNYGQGQKNLTEEVVMEKIKVQCSAYTAGFICRKMSRAINCKACLKTYTADNLSKIHDYIKFREYKQLKHSNLVYPSENFLMVYRQSSDIIFNYLNLYCNRPNVGTTIKNLLNKLKFSFGCSPNHKMLLINVYKNVITRLHVHNWCNTVNKILKGDVNEKYVENMGIPQKLALQKCKKYTLRKKTINK